MEVLIYPIIGIIAGFTAGLFGVGGGLIVVPLLYIVFTYLNYDSSIVMHMAVGTSLATIIITSISSISAHQKKHAILWQIVKNLVPGLIIGAFVGAWIADFLSGKSLQFIIGIFSLWIALKMFKGANSKIDTTQHLPSQHMQVFAGGGIGLASAIFGIGGGSLTVPYLNKYGTKMQNAVATSAACGLPIAITGAIGFMIFGQKTEVIIPNSIGYVQVYAFLGISIMSFITAKVGAKIAYKLSPKTLKKCFAGLETVVGIYFVGQSLSLF